MKLLKYIYKKLLKNEKHKKSLKEFFMLLGFRKIFSNYFYSQDGEELLIQSFGRYEKDYKGFYVDIGAYHPLIYSNTQWFYEKGWNGINIDARPGSMKIFNKIRKRDINLEIGISEKSAESEYYSFKYSDDMNSFNEALSKERMNRGDEIKEIIKIKVFSINEILEKYLPKCQRIDFITIDIEGHEFQIIKTLDFKKYSPRFFLVEDYFIDNDFMEYKDTELYIFLKERGYVVVGKTIWTILFEKKHTT
ncbi:MAG: FkbM family methyltransferase [Treponema sp.]|jgi:FkbM family methyltransferase|nr:FkbM family methyltransferase [Treponema sp.]